MTITNLKRILGTDAHALLDESSGLDGLKAVLQAVGRAVGISLNAYLETIAAATLNSWIVDAAGDYQASLRTAVTTTGSAGQTDVEIQKNGTIVGTALVTLNSDADGFKATPVLISLPGLVAGDVITLVVSAAPVAGVGLKASARITSLSVE